MYLLAFLDGSAEDGGVRIDIPIDNTMARLVYHVLESRGGAFWYTVNGIMTIGINAKLAPPSIWNDTPDWLQAMVDGKE